MNLYEIQNGMYGESHIRAYAWAVNAVEASRLYRQKSPGQEIHSIDLLLSSSDSPFCTKLSDDGWDR